MSILQYFTARRGGPLPNPNGPLSTKIPPAAISSANAEVRSVLTGEEDSSASTSSDRSRKGKKPHVYSPKTRAEIGRLASNIGATSAAKRVSRKLGFPVNESTARRFKKLYLQERKVKRLREEEDLTVAELPLKKRGRPLVLGKKLDEHVQEYILMLREQGCIITTEIVIATAKGLAKAIDRTRLEKYGGPATLGVPWAKSLLRRMNFTKRRASTKSTDPSQNIEEVKEEFLLDLIQVVELSEVPPDLIFNWDQTAISLVPSSQWTLDKKGKKRVAIAGHSDKRQITAVMCAALTGEVLPIQLVYEGKTNRCHPAYDFPANWVISHSPNHWSNEQTMIEYITGVIVPFVEQKRDDLELDKDHAAVAIFDHFKGQLTEKVTQLLEENNIHSVLIPAAYTGDLQPMDISVNKALKSFMRKKFSEWYAEQVTELYCNGEDDPVDLSSALMKCLGARWIEQAIEYLADNPHFIVSGFRHAGIYAALEILDNDVDELPDYDNTSAESDCDLYDENQLSQNECTSDSTAKHHLVKKVPVRVEDIFTPTEDEYSD